MSESGARLLCSLILSPDSASGAAAGKMSKSGAELLCPLIPYLPSLSLPSARPSVPSWPIVSRSHMAVHTREWTLQLRRVWCTHGKGFEAVQFLAQCLPVQHSSALSDALHSSAGSGVQFSVEWMVEQCCGWRYIFLHIHLLAEHCGASQWGVDPVL